MRPPGHEGVDNTPFARATNLRAQIREAIVNNQPGMILTIDLPAAACFVGIPEDEIEQLGEQDQHLKMTVDRQKRTMAVEVGIPPADMKQAAEFLVGLVEAEQINAGPEYLEVFGPTSQYLLNRIRGLRGAITMMEARRDLDDRSLDLLELQVCAMITGGNLDVPLPRLARAAAGR